jgi:hypothetical protein
MTIDERYPEQVGAPVGAPVGAALAANGDGHVDGGRSTPPIPAAPAPPPPPPAPVPVATTAPGSPGVHVPPAPVASSLWLPQFDKPNSN